VGSGLGYLWNFFKQDGWNVLELEPNVVCADMQNLSLESKSSQQY
jgi:hypothetical protein